MSYRAGFVGIIGLPNAGKSTLMNFLVKEKVSIVSNKPQTTRRRVLGIYSEPKGQLVFVDSPGVITASSGLNGFLAKEAEEVVRESDALMLLLSLDTPAPEDAQKLVDMVAASHKPWIGVISKYDLQEKIHRHLVLKTMIEKKGGKVYIEGRLQTRSWEDQTTKQKKYMTEIVANDLVLLSSRDSGGGGGGGGGEFASRTGGAAEHFDQRAPEPEPAGASPISDDDIPF